MSETRRFDPLLECIALFARLYGRPISIDALISGLPVEPHSGGPELFSIHSSKGLFSRVAKRAGFASRLIQRDLEQLSQLLLPCILVLKDRQACILESIDRERNMAKVIVPDVDDGENWVPLEKLTMDYLGHAFLLKKEYRYNSRSLQLINAREHHWFWGTLARSREIYGSVLLASFLVNLFVLVTPMFTMNVYDRVVPNNATDTLWVLAIGVALAYLFDAVLRYIRIYFLEVAGKKSDVIMSSMLFEQVMDLRMEQWPKSVGAFANNLREFEALRSFFTSSTLVTLVDLPFAILFLGVIAYVGGPVALVPLLLVTLLATYGLILVNPLRKSIESTYEAAGNKHALLVENLHAIQTIKTLGASHHAQWEWEEATGEIADKSLRAKMLSGSIGIVTQIATQLSTVGIVLVGIYLIKDLDLSLGGLVASVMLSSRAIAPMGQVAALIANYQQTRTAYRHLDGLMQLPIERPKEKNFVRRPTVTGELNIEHLEFRYPEAERASLEDINVRVTPGQRVGIIGKVGSGKTTLAKMLVGLYAPTGGSISLDGIDISQIDPADLRRNVAYVAQDVQLLRGTIRENIAFRDPHVDDELMLRAATIGGVDLFVNRQPLGFDTQVGEQGVGLSGGQRQCVAIARAALLDTPIVVLDEPTNAMDNTTEAEVRRRLLEYTRDKTTILVTHKPAMLDLVDRLIVLDEGRVVMDGPKAKVLDALQGRTSNAA